MTNNADRIAALEREVAALKAAKPAPVPSEAELAAFRSQMHAQSEARLARANYFSREDLAAMEKAAPAETCQDLWKHGTVQPPSLGGNSGELAR